MKTKSDFGIALKGFNAHVCTNVSKHTRRKQPTRQPICLRAGGPRDPTGRGLAPEAVTDAMANHDTQRLTPLLTG